MMNKLCRVAAAARVIALAVGLTIGSSLVLRAQADTVAEQATDLQLAALQAALQQMDVQLTDLQPVDQPPLFGTYYLASSILWSVGLGPPYPDNPWNYWSGTNLPAYSVYWMGTNANAYGNAYLVDDVAAAAALAEQREANLAVSSLQQQSGLASPDTDGPGDGGGADGPGPAYSYPINFLFLELTSVTNGGTPGGVAFLTIHGTVQDMVYEVLSRERLNLTNWISEGTLLGLDGQTPTTIAVGSRTNSLFLWARSWVDSQGIGIPDWWQLHYFGYVGIDPYADPDGDGWSNLQEYQNGTGPLLFDTPPAPTGLTASYRNGVATLRWNPSPGPVIAYVIERDIPDLGLTDFYTNAPSNTTHQDNPFPEQEPNLFFYPPTYEVTALYPGGSSPPSQVSLYTQDYSGSARFVRGPQGNLYLAWEGAAANAPTVQLVRETYDFLSGNYAYTNWTLATSSFTNGIYSVPQGSLPPLPSGDYWYLQTTNSSGLDSTVLIHSWDVSTIPFFDGREQLKQNLAFQLRAANADSAFSFTWINTNYHAYGHFSNSTNYAQAGLWNLVDDPDGGAPFGTYEFGPFTYNYLYRNFAFSPADVNSIGGPATGAGFDLADRLALYYPSRYLFQPPASTGPIASVLSTNDSRWGHFYPSGYTEDLGRMGITTGPSGTNWVMASGARNVFGLPYLSAKLAWGSNATENATLNPGGSVAGHSGLFYPETAQPVLQTVGYYFTTGDPPVPGLPEFSVTNTTPLLITSLGQPISLAGYAKQTILNGYTNKFAYLQQYFDKAYKIGTNGAATTNETGTLSPYGEFFPTEPGPTALRTMPDLNTGQQGTGIVNVIKLQLDVNHDGVMDLSFGGPDNTSQAKPFVFWANNDYDRLKSVDCPLACDTEQDDYLTADCPYTANIPTPDYAYRDAAGNPAIPCLRDLEDYTRLWTAGLSNVMAVMPTNYTVKLVLTGGAQLRIFRAYEANGGTNYLLDPVTASNQVANAASLYIGLLTSSSPITLSGRTNLGEHFIFCGAQRGSAQVDLQVLDGNQNMVADTTAYIQIQDIKEMYERWTVGDYANILAKTNAYLAVEGLTSGMTKFEYPSPTDANTPYILFVHGWNMEIWDKDHFAETAFKRLYLQGFQGRFGSFRWPTGNRFNSIISVAFDARNYDNSESNAWASATGLLNKLTDLNAQYPGHVYLMAHSMGNVVAGEALRLAGANQVVNTYVAMEAAIPAHCYDALTATNSTRTPPDRYAYYYTDGSACYFSATAGAQNYFNFYNQADYALSFWKTDQAFKPDMGLAYPGYHYSSSSGFYKIFGAGTNDIRYLTFPTNTYEIFAYGDPAWSYALGAQANVGGAFKSGATYNQVDLGAAPYNFGSAHKGHSAQFRSDNMNRAVFWHTTLDKMRLLP